MTSLTDDFNKKYLEWRRDALHGDRSAPEAVGVDAALANVDWDGEGVAEGDGSEEHLDADQKVLKNEIYFDKTE